jgi:hemerythrin-like domain-containing protein
MSDPGVRVFSPARDAETAAAMTDHNAATLQALKAHAEALVTVVSARGTRGVTQHAVDRLVDWCRAELVPHAVAEESTLYRPVAESDAGSLLVEGMLEEHRTIYRLVDELEQATDPVRAVATVGALEAVVSAHLAKEDDELLPLLVHSPYIALADALQGLEELVGLERSASRSPRGDGMTHPASSVSSRGRVPRLPRQRKP